MYKALLSLLFFCQLAFSQNDVNKLADSLTLDISYKDKSKIALEIATKLQDSDWKRASHYIEYSKALVQKKGSYQEIADNNIDIAEIYNKRDAIDVALQYYLKAYGYYQHDSLNKNKFHLENSLAIIYARLNNTKKAMSYFNDVLKYHTKKKETTLIAKTLNNIGTLYMSNDILDSAMIAYNKSLKLAEKLHDDKLRIILYNNLGNCYMKKNKFEQAKAYFDKSLSFKIIDKPTNAWVYNSISKLYLLKKQSDSALSYGEKAATLLKDSKYSFENKNAIVNIYKSYLLKGDYKNAAKYFEMYDEIRDSLNIEGKAMNVEKLKLEQQYKENEVSRVLDENKKKLKYYIIGFSLAIAMLALSILLIKYKNKLTNVQLENDLIESKKKELDANLELKNKELITLSMMEIQRSEILENIIDELKQLKLQFPKKETQQAINVIIKQLEKKDNNSVWEEFELHYGNVNESFYNILQEKHPELTYRDKRLCALLKLNLTTKEISQITRQSIKSLENARTRLRKKLQLTNTNVDLVTYLANLS